MKVQWDNCYNNWLYIGGHTLLYFMSPSSGLNSGLIESMYNCMIRQWWIISGRSAFHMHQERNGRTSGFTLSLSLLDFYCRDCRMGVTELAWSQYKIIWFESYASVIYFELFNYSICWHFLYIIAHTRITLVRYYVLKVNMSWMGSLLTFFLEFFLHCLETILLANITVYVEMYKLFSQYVFPKSQEI